MVQPAAKAGLTFVKNTEIGKLNNQMFDIPVQLQFCGHATLAAAHTIFESILQYET